MSVGGNFSALRSTINEIFLHVCISIDIKEKKRPQGIKENLIRIML